MPAVRKPLLIDQGATFALDIIRALDDAGLLPVNITGRKYYVQIKKSSDSDVVVYSGSTEGTSPDMTIPTGSDGLCLWQITDERTWSLPAPFEGVYDVIEDISGVRERIMEGPVTISPGVTRA